jgi:hypothetical protein
MQSLRSVDREGGVPGPGGTRLVCELGEAHVRAAVALVADEYWNVGVDRERLQRAMRGSTVLAGALDPEGRLVATARALSDGARSAWVGDVCSRGTGEARASGRRSSSSSSSIRGWWTRIACGSTRGTRMACTSFGFVDAQKEQREKKAQPSTEMVLRRR